MSSHIFLGNQFITSTAHKAELDDEVSFEKGVIVTVLRKNFDGWWLIRYRSVVDCNPKEAKKEHVH